MYIVAGDSWACGEWNYDPYYDVTHRGFSQYLNNRVNTPVINLGQPGGTNLFTCLQIKKFLNQLIDTSSIQYIFVFQTEWIRDYTGTDTVDVINLVPKLGYTDFKQSSISSFYCDLSEIAQTYDIKIKIIGGASDTIWLDRFEDEYPGCEILCQSFVSLCVNQTHRIHQPCFELSKFPQSEKRSDIISKVKPYSNDSDLEDFINDQDLAENRVDLFKKNPPFFYPDGFHANKQTHKILFDFANNKLNFN